jgi:hypothetical protein
LLDGVLADLFGLPCTNVSNLAVLIVVPALAGYWVSDGLAQLVRSGHGERLEAGKIGRAVRTTGEGHLGLENIISNSVMVSPKYLTGHRATLHDCDSRRQKNKVKGIRS